VGGASARVAQKEAILCWKEETKNVWPGVCVAELAYTRINKSLLLLFFRKEELALLRFGARP
jgi:hypothetical protein